MVQLFVRNLESRSIVYDSVDVACVSQLKDLVQAREGFSDSAWSCLGLEYGGKQLLRDEAALAEYGVGDGSTVRMVLRVRAGKGGFGALLRGQGRDGNITTNFDACRDLQGRRIRHSRCEQQLAEWQAQSKERELEKIAQKHIKELAKQQKREAREQVDVDKVLEEQKQAIEKVQAAVQSALAASSSAAAGSSKRKQALTGEGAATKPAAKKSKMLAALEEVEDSDEESEDEV